MVKSTVDIQRILLKDLFPMDFLNYAENYILWGNLDLMLLIHEVIRI